MQVELLSLVNEMRLRCPHGFPVILVNVGGEHMAWDGLRLLRSRVAHWAAWNHMNQSGWRDLAAFATVSRLPGAAGIRSGWPSTEKIPALISLS